MKPSLVPLWRAWNSSPYLRRMVITGCMSTSLKVVSMAAVRCASTKRAAMLARRRVIGTRRSTRGSAASVLAGGASAVAGAAGAGSDVAAGAD